MRDLIKGLNTDLSLFDFSDQFNRVGAVAEVLAYVLQRDDEGFAVYLGHAHGPHSLSYSCS